MKLRGKAVVRSFPYSVEHLENFLVEAAQEDEATRRLLLKYPTVYVIYQEFDGAYQVYVGETNDIAQRTKTHLEVDPDKIDLSQSAIDDALLPMEDPEVIALKPSKWNSFRDNDSTIIVIGHSLFNKSLTLDIEDRLMLYLSSVEGVKGADSVTLTNARRNIQTDYFTRDYVDDAFNSIWRKLRQHDPVLFPLERLIRESALFKASPFHQLNEQQVGAKVQILKAVDRALTPDEFQRDRVQSDLILVKGGAGTGKTVLLSSVFYDLIQARVAKTGLEVDQDFNAYLLVNHDEQVTVYEQIAEKLGLHDGKHPRVMKPTRFINEHQASGEKADVVFVDEAHLLWTQGKQSYRGENQFRDILELADVVVAVFDPLQVLAGNQFWTEAQLLELEARAGDGNIINLSQQMRIDSDGPAETWIRQIIDEGLITQIPTNDRYRIEVFDTPEDLHAVIRAKSDPRESSEVEKGLSRLIATYDWSFSSGKTRPTDSETWDVTIGDFRLPWNNQMPISRAEKKLSWAERDSTVGEVGSIFTVQGFDLNYAGVILGPSVKYRDGRIIFDKSESRNPNVTSKRSMEIDGKAEKLDVSQELLRNQLNVLLTRGVRGMGIYAVDDALREELRKAARHTE